MSAQRWILKLHTPEGAVYINADPKVGYGFNAERPMLDPAQCSAQVFTSKAHAWITRRIIQSCGQTIQGLPVLGDIRICRLK